jgi:Tol biopolymer transport system component
MVAYCDPGIVCWLPPDGYVVDDSLQGVWVINPEDGERTRILAGGDHPSWSPDGEEFVVDGGPLYIASRDGTRLRAISAAGRHHHPAWSPTGEWIAYDDGFDVWVVRSDGTDATNIGLVSGPRGSIFPQWSPDGQNVVHIRYPRSGDINSEIFVMGIDGTNLRQLTNSPRREMEASYSPNGQLILYTVENDYSSDLWLMAAEGGNERRLGFTGLNPAWSPSGQEIVYNRLPGCNDTERGVLWVIELESVTEYQLTHPWPTRCPASRALQVGCAPDVHAS